MTPKRPIVNLRGMKQMRRRFLNTLSDSEVTIQEMEGSIEQLTEEIAELEGGIKDLDKAVVEAHAQRKEENAEYKELAMDNSIMIVRVGAMTLGLDQRNFHNVQMYASCQQHWCESNRGVQQGAKGLRL